MYTSLINLCSLSYSVSAIQKSNSSETSPKQITSLSKWLQSIVAILFISVPSFGNSTSSLSFLETTIADISAETSLIKQEYMLTFDADVSYTSEIENKKSITGNVISIGGYSNDNTPVRNMTNNGIIIKNANSLQYLIVDHHLHPTVTLLELNSIYR